MKTNVCRVRPGSADPASFTSVPGGSTRQSRTRAAGLTAVTLAASLSTALAFPAAAQESVTLEFDWPLVAARVITETESETSTPMGPQSSSGTMAATVTVSEHPEGYLIAYSDYDFGDGLDLGALQTEDVIDALGPERLGEVMELAQTASSDVLVSGDGAFLRVADPADLQLIIDAMAGIFDRVAAMGPNPMLQGMRARLLNPETWDRMLGAAWQEQIGKWRGRWTAGEVRTDTTGYPNPLGDEPLSMLQGLTFEGTEPCPGGPGTCAVMMATARSDEALRARFQDLMNDMMTEMGAAGMELEISEFDLDQTTRLHFRVDGMVPMRSETTMVTRQVMLMMGREQVTEQSVVTRITWDWGS